MLKNLLTLLMTTFIPQMVAFCQYEYIDLSTDVHFKEIQFIDEDNGFLTGTLEDFTGVTSLLFHTNNGGLTWTLLKEMDIAGQSFHDIDFITSTYGYIGTQSTNDDGVLLVTDDAGQTLYWVNGVPSEQGIRSVDFLTEEKGFVITNENNLYQTNNGTLWTNGTLSLGNHELLKVYAYSNNKIFVLSQNGNTSYISTSINGGSSWTIQHNISKDITLFQYNDIYLYTTQNGSNFELHKSNNGSSYSNIYSGEDLTPRGIHIMDQNHYYITGKKTSPGSGDFVLRTLDGGNTWDLDTVMTSDTTLNVIHFLTEDFGLIGGNYGQFFKWTPDLGIHQTSISYDFLISPNPASEFLSIQTNFNLTMRLQLFDLRGRLVKEEEVYADESINISDLQPGVYMLYLYNENQLKKYEKVVIQ